MYIGEGSSKREVSPRAGQPIPCMKTSSMKKKRKVAVIGDSLLRGMEVPMH